MCSRKQLIAKLEDKIRKNNKRQKSISNLLISYKVAKKSKNF